MNWNAIFLMIACFYGFLSVAMGAFAAHGLKNVLEPQALGWIQTASHYQMIHAVLIIAIGLFSVSRAGDLAVASSLTTVMALFVAGVFFFSGSLYLMALTNQRFLGAITPIGGTLFLIGWVWLFVLVFKINK